MSSTDNNVSTFDSIFVPNCKVSVYLNPDGTDSYILRHLPDACARVIGGDADSFCIRIDSLNTPAFWMEIDLRPDEFKVEDIRCRVGTPLDSLVTATVIPLGENFIITVKSGSSTVAKLYVNKNDYSISWPENGTFNGKTEHHIMLDIETLGVTPGSVICSLAAVEFNLMTGETFSTFYERINIQSCLDAGLTVTGETISWWMQQSDAARAEVSGENRKSLGDVLRYFSTFLKSIDTNEKTWRIWGNGCNFDNPILEAAYKAVKVPIPWPFWVARDVRTIVSIFPEIKKSIRFEGVRHNPLDDCKHQIKYLSATMAKIKGC